MTEEEIEDIYDRLDKIEENNIAIRGLLESILEAIDDYLEHY